MLALEIPKEKKVYSRLVMQWNPDGSISTVPNECRSEGYAGSMIQCGPAIALAGAASGIMTGLSIGGFMGGMMIVGSIASGLGALTGNETLSKIGMGLSLAGGIGSAFMTPDGAFMNPFAEGNSFGDTALGTGIEKMKNGVKNFFGDVTGAPIDQLNIDGGAIINTAMPDVSAGAMTQGIVDAAPSMGVDLSSVAGNAAAAAPKQGLLASAMGNKDILSGLSGMADGYGDYQDRKMKEGYYEASASNAEANANLTNLQANQLQQRMNNMKAQPQVNLGVNPNVNVHDRAPGSAEGRVAVVKDGQVMYLSQTEYDAMRQAQQPSGLLATGAAA